MLINKLISIIINQLIFDLYLIITNLITNTFILYSKFIIEYFSKNKLRIY